jgi:diaminohydroxyphosphoribosylaminopyrimidine deaminase / 5-amino-6-(5-phosphoribosylamino)uracil reductase
VSERPYDGRFLLEAIECSRDATPSHGAFSVGCVIADADDRVVATGFSRERGPQSHAERVAIEKAMEDGAVLTQATLYSSMEPCSVRGSGLPSCAAHILEAGIPRVVFAMREPVLFVEGHGADVLRSAGVEVVERKEYAGRVAEINAHLFDDAP